MCPVPPAHVSIPSCLAVAAMPDTLIVSLWSWRWMGSLTEVTGTRLALNSTLHLQVSEYTYPWSPSRPGRLFRWIVSLCLSLSVICHPRLIGTCNINNNKKKQMFSALTRPCTESLFTFLWQCICGSWQSICGLKVPEWGFSLKISPLLMHLYYIYGRSACWPWSGPTPRQRNH